MNRRHFLHTAGSISALSSLGIASGCSSIRNRNAAKVVVIGGGFGGATAAKYVRMWSDHSIEVTLVEPSASFMSCPMSNLVLGGTKTMEDITTSYDSLTKRHGVTWVRDMATSIDPEHRRIKLSDGSELRYDRLILSPGIDFMWDALPGLALPGARERVLHAWKAGPQTTALRLQLEAMQDGGVYAMTIPLAPYRCPPGPYERACQIANYFRRSKPRSKVVILDANEDVTSKGQLFRAAWAQHYKGIVEYLPSQNLQDVDARSGTVKMELSGSIQADVLNVIPPMRAGEIAIRTGLANASKRWCEVDFLTFESTVAPNIHVLGDSIFAAPAMPKSGHLANQHGKTCAAAIVALLNGKEPNSLPIYNNTCYSFVNEEDAIHVSSVHRYDAQRKTMLTVAGAGGLSSAASNIEGRYAMAWARNIWADSLG
jgi:sulfide dehydrogenase [flavocytochrome c] flavoprotein chain